MQNNKIIIINSDTYIDNYHIPTCLDGSSIEDLMMKFLLAKANRTNSKNTFNSYKRILFGFREYLQENGLDLIMYTTDQQGWNDYRFIRSKISDHAEIYTKKSKNPNKKMVMNASRNQALACLSSFYNYADKNGKIPFTNPISTLEYSPVETFSGAKAIDSEDVRSFLKEIDRSTLIGKRDYALLQILLSTGSRINAILMTNVEDIEVNGRGNITLYLRHMKGGKRTQKQLSHSVSAFLIEYLEELHQKKIRDIEKHHPIFVLLTKAHNKFFKFGDRMSYQAARKITEKYLDTSKVHTTRHTNAKLLMDSNARLEDIMKELDHSDPKITLTYTKALDKKTNKFEKQIDELLGNDGY